MFTVKKVHHFQNKAKQREAIMPKPHQGQIFPPPMLCEGPIQNPLITKLSSLWNFLHTTEDDHYSQHFHKCGRQKAGVKKFRVSLLPSQF